MKRSGYPALGRDVPASASAGWLSGIPSDRTSVLSYANCFQGMGGHRPRARRGRAARSPCARAASASPSKHFAARARPLLPLSHVRPPAQRPGARVPPARAAPRPRGGRVGRRRAAAARADAWTAASPSPTACASAPGPRSPAHWTIADPRAVDALSPFYVWTTRLRREAAGLEAPPPAARAAAAHLPHPAAGDRQGRATSTAAAAPGWRSRATCRSRARPVLSDDEFDRARRGDRGDRPTAASPRCA